MAGHPPSQTPPSRQLERGLAFALAASGVVVLALQGGGSGVDSDIVTRQAIGLLVWTVIGIGFAVGVLPRAAPDRAALVGALAAAAMVIWILLSLIWTESGERTTAELARFVAYAGLTVLALSSLDRQTFRAAAGGIAAGVLGIAALSVASRLFPQSFPAAIDFTDNFRDDRLQYPLDYWNAVGAWGAMAVAIGLAWSSNAESLAVRALSLVALPIAGTAVYLTYSRAAVVASAIAIGAVIALSRYRWTAAAHALAAAAATAVVIFTVRENPAIADATGSAGGWEVAAALFVAALVCVAAALATYLFDIDRLRLSRERPRFLLPGLVGLTAIVALVAFRGPVSSAWDQFQNEPRATSGPNPAERLASASGPRDDLWSSAIDAFAEQPLTGLGPGTFEFWWSRDARNAEYVRDAHSLYLEHLAELGAPGLVLLLGFLGGMLGLALRSRRSLGEPSDVAAVVALTAAFLAFCLSASVDWIWESTAVAAVALGGIGVAAAGSSRRGEQRRGAVPARARVAIVAIAAAAAAVQVPGIVSTERLRESQDAAARGDLDRARELASGAIDAQPWAASPHEQLALVYEGQGRLEDARAEIGDAISKEETNWRYPLVLARIEEELGHHALAKQIFREGRRLRPLSRLYNPFSPFGRSIFTDEELQALIDRALAEQESRAP